MGTCQTLFSFTIQAVAVTFLKVIDQFAPKSTKVHKYFSRFAFPYFPGHNFSLHSTTTSPFHNVIWQKRGIFCTKTPFNSNLINCVGITTLDQLEGACCAQLVGGRHHSLQLTINFTISRNTVHLKEPTLPNLKT